MEKAPAQNNWHISKIGIAMAVYRPHLANFLEQLRSIENQTFTEWVCIITSDSSLEEIFNLKEFAPFVTSPRFRWVENSTQLGVKSNFEKAASLALEEKVDAISFCDQDDIWYPEKLAVSVKNLEKHGPLSLAHCDMHSFHGQMIDASSPSVWAQERRGVDHTQLTHLLVRNVVAGCALLIDAELVRRFPKIDPHVEYHDHWYALIASAYGGVHPIHQSLFLYRQHTDNVLGVTPFRGIFSRRHLNSSQTLLAQCKEKWLKSHDLAIALRASGFSLSRSQQIIFISKWDCGIAFLLLALQTFWNDPAFGRACLARAVGKFFQSIPFQH